MMMRLDSIINLLQNINGRGRPNYHTKISTKPAMILNAGAL
jgi:hypothetical protein